MLDDNVRLANALAHKRRTHANKKPGFSHTKMGCQDSLLVSRIIPLLGRYGCVWVDAQASTSSVCFCAPRECSIWKLTQHLVLSMM